MGIARLRALTQFLVLDNYFRSIGRNGNRPTEGIDTGWPLPASLLQFQVEMSTARLRALTPLEVGLIEFILEK